MFDKLKSRFSILGFPKRKLTLRSAGPAGSCSSIKFWVIFSTLYLVISCCISYFGLFGDWRTYVFGVRCQNIWDPSSAYLASGISFFEKRHTYWVGHPGLFLMLLVQLIARSYYWIGSICIETPVTYYSFLAKNLFGLIFITKLAMTAINLLSFYVLYSLSLKVLRDKWLARNAVIAYATTYTVLYYINFVVPEPLLVLFTLLSIDCAWKSYESRDHENGVRKYQYIALSAFYAIAAFFTKMMIAVPLVILIPVFLLFQKKSLTEKIFLPLRERILSASTFIGAAVPFVLLCAYKVNWTDFLKFWFRYAPGSLSFDSSKSFLLNVGANSLEFLERLGEISFRRISSSYLLFGHDKMRLFIMAELIFFVCAAIGVIQYYAKFKDKRMHVYWMVFLVVSISPVVLYAWEAHYFYIHLAIASIFFSHFINNIIGGKLTNRLGRPLVAVIITLVIHLGSITLFVDAKRFDVVEYQRNWRPYHEALASIDYDGKIGVLGEYSASSVSGRMFRWGTRAVFQAEFSKFFVPVTDASTAAQLQEQDIQVVIEHTSEGVRWRRIIDRCIQEKNTG